MSVPHKVLTLDYILRDPAGEVMDRSEPGEPMVLHLDAGQVPEGFEEAVQGMVAGETLRFTVPPEKGFGLRDEGLVQDLPREMFPPDMDLKPGATISFETEQGDGMLQVLEADGESVRCDFNHPLAGQPLDFEVSCLRVEEHAAEDCDLHDHDDSCACGCQ